MSYDSYLVKNENTIFELTKEDLKLLFDLIPIMRVTKDYKNSLLVKEFPELAYKSKIMLDFDWSKWDKGNEIVMDDNFDYSTLDKISLCKLLTAIVQSERYIHNGLIDYFEDNSILKLLESLEKTF